MTEETLAVRNSFVAALRALREERAKTDITIELLEKKLREYENEHGFTDKMR